MIYFWMISVRNQYFFGKKMNENGGIWNELMGGMEKNCFLEEKNEKKMSVLFVPFETGKGVARTPSRTRIHKAGKRKSVIVLDSSQQLRF